MLRKYPTPIGKPSRTQTLDSLIKSPAEPPHTEAHHDVSSTEIEKLG